MDLFPNENTPLCCDYCATQMKISSCAAALLHMEMRIPLQTFFGGLEEEVKQLSSRFIPRSITSLSSEYFDSSVLDITFGTVEHVTSPANDEPTGEETYGPVEHALKPAMDDPAGVETTGTSDHDREHIVCSTMINVTNRRKRRRRQ